MGRRRATRPDIGVNARDDLDFTTPPARRDTAAAAGPEVVIVRRHVAHDGNRVVLVVDGDAAAGERTATILREAGYHAVAEGSPRAAARHMSRLGAPALLLLEDELPEMSGFEFLEGLRASQRLKDTPVVMLATHATRADQARAFRAGADGYISKSVDAATLLAALRKVLDE